MIAALLLSLIPGLWDWDATPGAAEYLFCWTDHPSIWYDSQCAKLGDTLSFDDTDLDDFWGTRLDDHVLYLRVFARFPDGTTSVAPGGATLRPAPYVPWVCP